MKRIKRCFLRGLLFGVPIGLTVYLCYAAFAGIDGLLRKAQEAVLGRTYPGLGFATIVVAIFLVGVLASSFLTRRLLNLVGRLFERLPLAKLLYTSIRDLMAAFVGEKKRFDRPVLVRLGGAGSDARVMGFVTNDDLRVLGLEGDVAVYVPQSYNFAGNLVIVPRASVAPIAADAGLAMKFIVSGGVSTDEPRAGAAPGA